jgi:hypothetical protein
MKFPRNQNRVLWTSLIVPAIIWSDVARGAWEVVPEILIEVESNDNPRLLPDAPEFAELTDDPATRLIAELGAQFANIGQRGEFVIEPRILTDTYADSAHDSLQSTDGFLNSSAVYRWERSAAGFNAALARERILGTEFLDAQPGDIDATDPDLVDTVLLGLNERRNRFLLSPFAEFGSSTEGTFRIDSRLTGVRYDGDPATERSDFDDLGVGAQYTRRVNELSTLTGRVFASRFEADANQNETDTAGIEVRYSRELSAIWSLDLRFGAEGNEFTYVDPDLGLLNDSDDNYSFATGFRRRAERSSLNFDLLRQIGPDSFGFLVARNQLRMTVLGEMSPRLNGYLALRVIESEGIRDDIVQEDRKYGRAEIGINWALGELWALTAAYEYSSRDVTASEFEAGNADSNSVSLGFRYRGRSRRQ